MYQLIETSEILNINTIKGVSIKELENAERMPHTPKHKQETLVSTAFMKHIVNETNDFSKATTTTDSEESRIVKTCYFSVAEAVEKVTYEFIKK